MAARATMKQRPRIAITCGEPAGIGPEIAIRSAWQLRSSVDAILIGDAALLAMTAASIDASIQLVAVSLQAVRNGGLPNFGADRVAVIDCPLEVPVVPGQLNRENGRSVLQTLDIAVEAAQSGWVEAMVTAPLQKSTINDAGVPFTGHTEYLAEKTGTAQVVMMLASTVPPLRVALSSGTKVRTSAAVIAKTDLVFPGNVNGLRSVGGSERIGRHN